MKVEAFDFHLPKTLIAQYPPLRRGESRLMVLRRDEERIEHRKFSDLIEYLRPGDLLVMNNTRVLPAKLIGHKETGGKVELLLIPPRNGSEGEWEALVKNLGKGKGPTLVFLDEKTHLILSRKKDGKVKVLFPEGESPERLLNRWGHIPLPPYIRREEEPLDRERYQTVYAKKEGSIAAPTAGLHFTRSLIQKIKEKGIETAFITLHVGPGTFAPIKAEEVEEHRMEPEWVEIQEEVAATINRVKQEGRRVIAVGTTTTRALESFAAGRGRANPGAGLVSLFIRPPYEFKIIDGLITNFHLPKSTLIMLVSAFAGRDFIMRAYREAVEKRYRFYSYGDAMLIL
ncbi:MAG: tRNA preQ1(34) S-adenosylmethionine ribosyltransferase-isomerase QueA [Desulfobacterota bacterium]|nr:tRNA preQ1(34) S-adenosylmethionine ribosyltransferase-isomerase QueA [Thermodesulfobacteriota bacterium]